MPVRVIGVDGSTNATKVGLALGEVEGSHLRILEATVCSNERSPVGTIADWIKASKAPALLAIDAPLGWPARLGTTLASHHAGAFIEHDGHAIFRRATDRFIAQTIGITPLDVGADRIARTALSALRIIGELRQQLRAPLPLAWSFKLEAPCQLIEVYPAATLRAWGFLFRRYKGAHQCSGRQEILRRLSTIATMPPDLQSMEANADALDAAVCLLAARDFLIGEALPPPDASTLKLAEREGWIWVRGGDQRS